MYSWLWMFQTDCTSQVTTYKLVSVICHHGTIGSGGHYTCYSLNPINEQWYEFDDQCVTLVSAEIVRNSEAYVLFYKLVNNCLTICQGIFLNKSMTFIVVCNVLSMIFIIHYS